MIKEYPLTLEHVKQYIATKQDDDELGICGNAFHCLLAETLNWLYPEIAPWRVDMNDYGAARGIGIYKLSRAMICVQVAFDNYDTGQDFHRRFNISLSKATFRDFLSENDLIRPSALFEEAVKV